MEYFKYITPQNLALVVIEEKAEWYLRALSVDEEDFQRLKKELFNIFNKNLIIIKGSSASGKTTFLNILRNYANCVNLPRPYRPTDKERNLISNYDFAIMDDCLKGDLDVTSLSKLTRLILVTNEYKFRNAHYITFNKTIKNSDKELVDCMMKNPDWLFDYLNI